MEEKHLFLNPTIFYTMRSFASQIFYISSIFVSYLSVSEQL